MTDPAPRPSGRLMWLMMAGCCLAIPLALIIAGVTAGGLAGASPWLVAAAAVIAVALVVVHRRSGVHGCEPPSLRSDPQAGDSSTPYSARMPEDGAPRTMRS